jgi:hypothetical protein
MSALAEWPTAMITANGGKSPDNVADLWVFVDGRPVWKRIHVNTKEKVTPVNVKLGPSDRFLTMVVTDGGDGIYCDWVVFGDPVLDMQTVFEATSSSRGSEQQEHSTMSQSPN